MPYAVRKITVAVALFRTLSFLTRLYNAIQDIQQTGYLLACFRFERNLWELST